MYAQIFYLMVSSQHQVHYGQCGLYHSLVAYGQVLSLYKGPEVIQKENCYLREWNIFVQKPNVYPVIHLEGLSRGSMQDLNLLQILQAPLDLLSI